MLGIRTGHAGKPQLRPRQALSCPRAARAHECRWRGGPGVSPAAQGL